MNLTRLCIQKQNNTVINQAKELQSKNNVNSKPKVHQVYGVHVILGFVSHVYGH